MHLIKKNMKTYVKVLLNMLMKQKIFFYKHDYKNKFNFFLLKAN